LQLIVADSQQWRIYNDRGSDATVADLQQWQIHNDRGGEATGGVPAVWQRCHKIQNLTASATSAILGSQ